MTPTVDVDTSDQVVLLEAYRNLRLAEWWLEDDKNPYAALEEVYAAVKANPAFTGGWLFAAQLHLALDEITEGLRCIEKVLEINPNESEALALKAFALYESKRYAWSLVTLQTLFETIDPVVEESLLVFVYEVWIECLWALHEKREAYRVYRLARKQFSAEAFAEFSEAYGPWFIQQLRHKKEHRAKLTCIRGAKAEAN